jgi:hypothetical protein
MLYRGLAYPGDAGGLVLSPIGWLVLVAGVACFVLGLAMLGYTRHLSVPPQPMVAESPTVAAQSPSQRDEVQAPTPEGPDISYLKDDERKLYDIIVDRGGEVLQRDLVASGEFSKAKVTRLLDKLEGKELIRRERHGMTNMVKLVR